MITTEEIMDIESIKARIEEKRKSREALHAEQEQLDWVAYEAACDAHGYDACARLKLPRKIDGLPTFLVVRAASADIMTVHRRKILKAKRDANGVPDAVTADNAIAEVGHASIVYPDADTVVQIKEHFPTVEKDAGAIAHEMSRMQLESEGKE